MNTWRPFQWMSNNVLDQVWNHRIVFGRSIIGCFHLLRLNLKNSEGSNSQVLLPCYVGFSQQNGLHNDDLSVNQKQFSSDVTCSFVSMLSYSRSRVDWLRVTWKTDAKGHTYTCGNLDSRSSSKWWRSKGLILTSSVSLFRPHVAEIIGFNWVFGLFWLKSNQIQTRIGYVFRKKLSFFRSGF